MARNRDCTVFLLACLAFCIFYLAILREPIMKFNFSRFASDSAVNKISQNYSLWNECLSNNISIYRDDPSELWKNLWKGIEMCEKREEMKYLKIESFSNSDETKRHIVSKLEVPSVIITLGIGHDTAAEEKLIKRTPTGSEFFGADPMHEINEDLYTKLPGHYFPFAIGATAGLSEANVLINTSYVVRTVVNVDILYFLKEIVQRSFIDDMWIDSEGSEYGMMSYFYNGGKFDQNNIQFCQFNIEIHSPDELQKKLIHDFIFQLLSDRRYAIFRPVQARHMRLYMVNFAHEECAYKYIL